MTKTRVSVDTGSVHLPVGEDNLGAEAARAPRDADAMAVSRFRHAFDGSRPARPSWELEEEQELQSPFALLAGVEDAPRADPSAIGAEIERLWVSVGVSGVREVRMKLGESLLPGTSVRIHEAGGLLHVDLGAIAGSTRRWLASALPQLAQDLGERLRRPVRVTLLAAGAGEDAVSHEWPQAQGT